MVVDSLYNMGEGKDKNKETQVDDILQKMVREASENLDILDTESVCNFLKNIKNLI